MCICLERLKEAHNLTKYTLHWTFAKQINDDKNNSTVHRKWAAYLILQGYKARINSNEKSSPDLAQLDITVSFNMWVLIPYFFLVVHNISQVRFHLFCSQWKSEYGVIVVALFHEVSGIKQLVLKRFKLVFVFLFIPKKVPTTLYWNYNICSNLVG